MKQNVISALVTTALLSFSSNVLAIEDWQPQNYSGGAEVCYQSNHFQAKWWANSSDVPDVNGPTEDTQPNWGVAPWLPLLDSEQCSSVEPPPSNTPPVADAGSDVSIQSPAPQVELNASKSFDPDGNPLSYYWTQESGPDVAINNQDQAIAYFSIPPLSQDTEYLFQVMVSDGEDETSAQVKITGKAESSSSSLTIKTPAKPSNAPDKASLFLTSDTGTVEIISVDWSKTTNATIPNANYNTVLPFTQSAIPDPMSATFAISETDPASLSWRYNEHSSDESYFKQMDSQSCSACHNGGYKSKLNDGPSEGLLAEYATNPNIISQKLNKMAIRFGVTCDVQCQKTMSRYLEDELWSEALGNIAPRDDVYGKRHIRMLTRKEYINSIQDLLGVHVPPNVLPLDERSVSSLYDNPPSLGYLTSDKLNAYLNSALFVQDNLDIATASGCDINTGSVEPWNSEINYPTSGTRVSHKGDIYESMYWVGPNIEPIKKEYRPGDHWKYIGPHGKGDSDCLPKWLTNTAEKLFHRPLTDSELKTYISEDVSTTKQNLSAMLVSPHFLYRREVGTSNANHRYSLNSYELATILSYTLWGSVPDDVLWALAKNNELLKSNVLKNEITRMLNHDNAKRQFANFMMQTLEFSDDRVIVDREGLSKEIGTAMLEEFRRYIEHAVFDDNQGRFEDLMSSTTTFVDHSLAQHYGLSGSFGADFKAVTIPPTRGKGLLSLGAIAVAYSTSDKTRVIPRGRMVQHSLLGWNQSVPSGAAPDDVIGEVSTRDFWTQATGPSQSCWGCHVKMNDIGFAYDVLDKNGRYRTYEDYISLSGEEYPNVLLETSGTLSGIDNQDVAISGLGDMATALSISTDAKKTFVKNYMTYTLGSNSPEYSTLYNKLASFEQFKQLIINILSSDTVLEREE
ncbi:DUF1592 domain-containing protein [Vibrio nomapromontoriensis]|uniref:DUF1592 domain-containing protein n=1 Tax=Vibrio nomapromontoriensis TaxID=2910246 RepID=UPI003D0C6E6C